MSFDQDPSEYHTISGADFAMMCDEIKAQKEQIKELESKLEKAEKDQARYQWLRNPDNQLHEDMPCVSDAFFATYFLEDLDKVVDALIAESQQ